MVFGVGGEIGLGQEQESAGGGETPAMLVMMGMEKLEAQMDESSGQLDQSLVKPVIGVRFSLTEPEILEHVVGLVVASRVKALQIAGEVNIRAGNRGPGEFLNELRDAFGLRPVIGVLGVPGIHGDIMIPDPPSGNRGFRGRPRP